MAQQSSLSKLQNRLEPKDEAPKTLINHLPAILTENADLNAAFDSEEQILTRISQEILQASAEQFLETASLTGISQWERLLNLKPDVLQTALDQRRLAVQTKLLEHIPFTYRTLKEKLDMILAGIPYQLTLDHNNYTFTIKIISEKVIDTFYYNQIDNTVYVMVPANIFSKVEITRQLALQKISIGISTQSGIITTIKPVQKDELRDRHKIIIGIFMKQGSTTSIFPKSNRQKFRMR